MLWGFDGESAFVDRLYRPSQAGCKNFAYDDAGCCQRATTCGHGRQRPDPGSERTTRATTPSACGRRSDPATRCYFFCRFDRTLSACCLTLNFTILLISL